MTIYINRILKKKRLSGEDVGKALVYSVIHDIAHKEEELPFTQSHFGLMESSITKEEDYLTYSVYKGIYEGLLKAYNDSLSNEHQFNNGFHLFTNPLRQCFNAEYQSIKSELVPYVMTKTQYETILENARRRLGSQGISFYDILCDLICQFTESPSTAPPEIREALEATKGQPVTNKRILEAYCKYNRLGYYVLPDGTRSDRFTQKEWERKLSEEYPARNESSKGISEKIKGYKLFYKGEEYIKEFYKEQTGAEITPEEEKDLEGYLSTLYFLENPVIKRVAPRSNTALQIYFTIKNEVGNGAKWVYYSEPPSELSKYDILKNHSINFYDGSHNPDGKTYFSEFKKDYPALSKALISYVKESVPKAKSLKSTQYKKDFITRGELVDLGIGRYKSLTSELDKFYIVQELEETDEDTTINIIKRQRILHNGIVISQDAKNWQIDKNGQFIDDYMRSFSLETLFDIDTLTAGEGGEKIKAFRNNLIIPTLKRIYGFNALIKILGSLFDMEEMEEVAINTSSIEEKVTYINQQIYTLYYIAYGSEEDKAFKRKRIKEVFLPISESEVKPTAEAIEALTKELAEAKKEHDLIKLKLKNFNTLIDKLYAGGE